MCGRVGRGSAAQTFVSSGSNANSNTPSVITSYSIHYTKLYELALMRDGATLINTARGAIVDHAALEAVKHEMSKIAAGLPEGMAMVASSDVITSYSIHYTKLYELALWGLAALVVGEALAKLGWVPRDWLRVWAGIVAIAHVIRLVGFVPWHTVV